MLVDVDAAQLDLRFEAELNGENLSISCEYKTELFKRETIEQLLASFRGVLEALLKNPTAKRAELGITPELAAQAKRTETNSAAAPSSDARKGEEKIAIAATFTAEPVEEPLRY